MPRISYGDSGSRVSSFGSQPGAGKCSPDGVPGVTQKKRLSKVGAFGSLRPRAVGAAPGAMSPTFTPATVINGKGTAIL